MAATMVGVNNDTKVADYHTILEFEYCDIYKKDDNTNGIRVGMSSGFGRINKANKGKKGKKGKRNKDGKEDKEGKELGTTSTSTSTSKVESIYYPELIDIFSNLKTLIFYNCTFEFILSVMKAYHPYLWQRSVNIKDMYAVDAVDAVDEVDAVDAAKNTINEIYICLNKKDPEKNQTFIHELFSAILMHSKPQDDIKTNTMTNIYLYDEWQPLIENMKNRPEYEYVNTLININYISPMEFIGYLDTLDMSEDIVKYS